jgi:hypothetical protein
MNQFFTKLEANVPNIDYSILKGELFYSYKENSLSYYYINDEQFVKDSLPKEFFNIEHTMLFLEITKKEIISPHVDYEIMCSINFYFNPDDSFVLWYLPKENSEPIKNDSNRYITYKHNDLILSDKFKPKKNECFLFNNSKIHSVIKKDTAIRQFIQIHYYEPYNVILQKLGAN